MAEGPLNAIGLVSGVLGIVGFFQSNFAEKPKEGSVIRVKAGLAQGDEDVSTVSCPFKNLTIWNQSSSTDHVRT